MKMRLLLVLLLLVAPEVLAQVAPPTSSIKKRHGQNTLVAWDYDASAIWEPGQLQYFSIKRTSNPNATPIEFKQVPQNERQTTFPAVFDPQSPKYLYIVVQAVYSGSTRESLPSNTVMIERIGPPPQ